MRALTLFAVLPAAVLMAAPQHPLDGIAAAVNEEIISIGEVRRAARLAREERFGLGALCRGERMPAAQLAAGTPIERAPVVAGQPLSNQELEQARECLIDTRLVFREVRRFPRIAATDEQIDQLVADLVERFESAVELEAELERVGLTNEELRADLRRQLLVSEYIDNRFLATVDITDQAAREAWDTEFVPDMQARGIPVPPYETVAEDLLVPILQQREVNRRVQSWILDLRERATIRRKYP
ncbi:MAG: hypothetical protein GKS06_03820 [Acidobacteria bacterium]|nr:hypothetical protein [Acidobacteriota bacterium]